MKFDGEQSFTELKKWIMQNIFLVIAEKRKIQTLIGGHRGEVHGGGAETFYYQFFRPPPIHSWFQA